MTNRLKIWREVPSKLWDAPGGWGSGNSASAYSEWYQNLEHNERYLHLVSSHLTWLVELGWFGRLFYVLRWLMLVAFCMPQPGWFSVVMGLWVAFLVASAFSAVAHEPTLWTLPLAGLCLVAAVRVRGAGWPRAKGMALAGGVGVVFMALAALLGSRSSNGLIHRFDDFVRYGGSEPDVWILMADEFPEKMPGRSLRSRADSIGGKSVALASYLNSIPANAEKVALGPKISPALLADALNYLTKDTEIIILNPQLNPKEIPSFAPNDNLQVYFGEYSTSRSRQSWKEFVKVNEIPGVGDYVADWPAILLVGKETE